MPHQLIQQEMKACRCSPPAMPTCGVNFKSSSH